MPDRVHMLPAIPPKHGVARAMGHLKGKGSLTVFGKCASLKYKFGNRKFWVEGCCGSTAGREVR